MILFSVIIPTCNRNDLLQQCLQKLAPGTQTLDPDSYEVIVTDDGKNEAAKLLVESSFSWVTWVKGPRKGPAANRNNGAAFAKGQWLVFFDDDCLPELTILSEYHNYVNNNADFRVFEGKIMAIGERESPLEYAPINMEGGKLWSCNFLIHADVFKQIKGFDEKFKYPHMEDIDLMERILAGGNKIYFASDAAVAHPWRKLTDGRKLGMYQEMYIYYQSKHGKKVRLGKLLWSITMVHFGLLKSSLFNKDSLMALKIMFQHLGTVLVHFNKWKKLYVGKSQS